MPFKDRFKGPFKGPFKGRNRAASAEQLEVMQSYNSQETTIFFCEKPKFVARRRSERKQMIWPFIFCIREANLDHACLVFTSSVRSKQDIPYVPRKTFLVFYAGRSV